MQLEEQEVFEESNKEQEVFLLCCPPPDWGSPSLAQLIRRLGDRAEQDARGSGGRLAKTKFCDLHGLGV